MKSSLPISHTLGSCSPRRNGESTDGSVASRRVAALVSSRGIRANSGGGSQMSGSRGEIGYALVEEARRWRHGRGPARRTTAALGRDRRISPNIRRHWCASSAKRAASHRCPIRASFRSSTSAKKAISATSSPSCSAAKGCARFGPAYYGLRHAGGHALEKSRSTSHACSNRVRSSASILRRCARDRAG